jgi:hypothetical protein
MYAELVEVAVLKERFDGPDNAEQGQAVAVQRFACLPITVVEVDLREHDKVQKIVQAIDDDDEVLQTFFHLSTMKQAAHLDAALGETVDRVDGERERFPHILFVSRVHELGIGLL